MIVQKEGVITISRIHKGMTERALAKKAGLSNTTVNLVEKNMLVLPTTAKKYVWHWKWTSMIYFKS